MNLNSNRFVIFHYYFKYLNNIIKNKKVVNGNKNRNNWKFKNNINIL